MTVDKGTTRPTRTVPAQWALVSKRLDPSGTYAIDGYEVVGTSGSMAVAQSLQETGLTGTPSSTAVGTPDALPWVIVTAGNGPRPMMAMSVMISSPLRTEGGRPVTPTRILWTDWLDAAAHRLTWTGMAFGHQKMPWPETRVTGQSPIAPPTRMDIVDIPAQTVAGNIDRFGFDWLAGLAGLVLEGRRIAIVAEAVPLPGLDDRVALFDAVCALLPYGRRTRFSAATWARANVEHGVQLVFADTVAKDQVRVVWQEPPPRPRSADAADYVTDLIRLRRGEAKFRTLDIVEHLVNESDPNRCRDALSARRCLLAMDLTREVVRLIQSGRASVSDVQQVLAQHPLDTLPSKYAQILVQFLADRGPRDKAAPDLLLRTWSAETERRLGSYGRAQLTEASLPGLRSWFALADQAGEACGLNLLRELLRPTESMRDLRPAAADAALKLLADVKGAIKDPVIQQHIADQPAICVALLRQILDRGIPLERAVDQIDRWLADPGACGRPWLVPFGFAIGRGAPTDDQWRVLWSADDRVWLVLLNIAKFARQSVRVFAAMWPALVERAGLIGTEAENLAFEAELDLLTPDNCGLAEIEWARIDVLHLVRFGQLPGITMGAVALPDYAEAFRLAWYNPVLAEHRAEMHDRLIQALFPATGSTALQGYRLMAIVSVVDPQLMDLAARAIAQQVDARPSDFVDLVFGADWIERIRHVSTLERFWAYQRLRTLVRTGAAMDQIVAAYVHGGRVNLSFDDLERVMFEWFQGNSPQSAGLVLTELWRHGRADDAERMRKRMSGGAYGQPLADAWNAFAADTLLFAQWQAGKTRPPKVKPQPAPPPQRAPVPPAGAHALPPADSNAGKRPGPVSRFVGGILHVGAKNDENPAPTTVDDR
ncbi:hypothetical protein [Dactylosporangium sp. NPDC051541]|uniref:hypothetical protein n=1 Tax=Dactylosporangium sp. NPDC051541 TaxID=3363977 RepID=UPI0037AF4646